MTSVDGMQLAQNGQIAVPQSAKELQAGLPTRGREPYGRTTEPAICHWLLSVREDARRKPGKRPPILRGPDQIADVTAFIRSWQASKP